MKFIRLKKQKKGVLAVTNNGNTCKCAAGSMVIFSLETQAKWVSKYLLVSGQLSPNNSDVARMAQDCCRLQLLDTERRLMF